MEYLKLIKYRQVFIDERRECLFLYVSDENVIGIIETYLDSLEYCVECVNDEKVICSAYDIDVELVIIYMHSTVHNNPYVMMM